MLSHESEDFLERARPRQGGDDPHRHEPRRVPVRRYGRRHRGLGRLGCQHLAGIASFGGTAAYIGKVFDDQLGAVFAHDLRAIGVIFQSPPATDGPPTGRSLIVVTPDARAHDEHLPRRLRAFGPEDVDAELIAAAQVTFLEGYLFDRPEAKEAYWKASRDRPRPRSAGGADALRHVLRRAPSRRLAAISSPSRSTSSSPTTTRPAPLSASTPWTRPSPESAADVRDRRRDLRRRRARSSCTATRPSTCRPIRCARVVDTTGAGDLYAAGFLFGLTRGEALGECGRLGSLAASAVLGHTGARPGLSLAQLL